MDDYDPDEGATEEILGHILRHPIFAEMRRRLGFCSVECEHGSICTKEIEHLGPHTTGYCTWEGGGESI